METYSLVISWSHVISPIFSPMSPNPFFFMFFHFFSNSAANLRASAPCWGLSNLSPFLLVGPRDWPSKSWRFRHENIGLTMKTCDSWGYTMDIPSRNFTWLRKITIFEVWKSMTQIVHGYVKPDGRSSGKKNLWLSWFGPPAEKTCHMPQNLIG